MSKSDDQAVCRGCGAELSGSPYHRGGTAYVQANYPGVSGERAKANYYGGWVCSRSCDYRASLELERSMPGHGTGQTKPGSEAMSRINSNWPDE